MPALISVIIPCYNKGQYLNEALESVAAVKTPYHLEYIIVDDGSTEEETLEVLNDLTDKGFTIIHQENMGPASARNTALSHAKGNYILPLDCDNKITETYLTKAIKILETNSDIDVVYGNSYFFDKEVRDNKIESFDIYKILEGNYIDTCAVIRKSILKKVNGYDTEVTRGHEDWELWINVFFNGGKFYYLDEVCFYYRVTDNSLRAKANPETGDSRKYIMKKHFAQVIKYYESKIDHLESMRSFYAKHRYKTAAKLLFNSNFKL